MKGGMGSVGKPRIEVEIEKVVFRCRGVWSGLGVFGSSRRQREEGTELLISRMFGCMVDTPRP